jgi:hypothetical protein
MREPAQQAERPESSIDIAPICAPLVEVARLTGANIKLVEDPPPAGAGRSWPSCTADYAELRNRGGAGAVFDKPTTSSTDDSVTDDYTEYHLVVNREKATLAGIAPAKWPKPCARPAGGMPHGHLAFEREPVPIRSAPAAAAPGRRPSKVFFTGPRAQVPPPIPAHRATHHACRFSTGSLPGGVRHGELGHEPGGRAQDVELPAQPSAAVGDETHPVLHGRPGHDRLFSALGR